MAIAQLLPVATIVLATLLAALHLQRRGLLSPACVKRQWKSLSALYGAALGINFLVFRLILPANAPGAGIILTPASATPTAIATAMEVIPTRMPAATIRPTLTPTAVATWAATLAPAAPADAPPLIPLDTPDPSAFLSCH